MKYIFKFFGMGIISWYFD